MFESRKTRTNVTHVFSVSAHFVANILYKYKEIYARNGIYSLSAVACMITDSLTEFFCNPYQFTD